MLTRENAIIHANTVQDLRDHVGCAGTISGSGTFYPLEFEGAAPKFLVIRADEHSVSVVPLHGGLAGTVKVKLLTEVSLGHELYFAKQGEAIGFADLMEGEVSGTFHACALALEFGLPGEMIEAVVFRPEQVTIS